MDKAIIEEKIKYRQRTDDVPVYDERYAGTRGIGGNYAEGGRVGMWRGGVPKGLAAALRAIRSKFGDDSIKTVTETDEFSGLPVANIDTPEKSIIRNKIQNFQVLVLFFHIIVPCSQQNITSLEKQGTQF